MVSDRALGGTASDIKKQFLTEGIALTLIGGITGYLLGMIIAYLASMALPFSVRPDLMTVSLAIGFLSLSGLYLAISLPRQLQKRLNRYYEII